MTFATIPQKIQENGRRFATKDAYHIRRDGRWIPTTWKAYSANVRETARALIALGFEAQQSVCILGFNRPEWSIFHVAAMTAGGAAAGIYTTCSPEEVQYITHHAEASIILLEDEGQWEKINTERERLPHLKHVVMMEGAPEIDDELVLSWGEFLAKAADVPDEAIDEAIEAIDPEQLATLIYTSGTTGPPKGVMLSHRSLAWTAQCVCDMTGATSEEVALSYLPLSHIAEQMFTILAPAMSGHCVYYAESIDAVPANLKEVQPTVFFGVPRIWEKFYAGISTKLQGVTGAKAKLIRWAQSVGRQYHALANRGIAPNRLLRMQYQLADKLIYSKLKPAIGLGRAKICVTGAAPIDGSLLNFFTGLDLVVLEVYGQSEDCGPTSFNLPGQVRFGTVGQPIPGVDVKIADDGEILVKGPNVFKGYYKDEAATTEAFEDGWLCSGDLGFLDDEGFLNINGRKKEIIITAGGKNVTPKNIEELLKRHDLINEAIVIGDRRKYLIALVTIDPEVGAAWAQEHGVDPATLHENAALRAVLDQHREEINQKLARVEQIKKLGLLPRNLTLEDGELTPTLKVKRRGVNENWGAMIDGLYE